MRTKQVASITPLLGPILHRAFVVQDAVYKAKHGHRARLDLTLPLTPAPHIPPTANMASRTEKSKDDLSDNVAVTNNISLDERTDSLSEKGIPSGTLTPGSTYANIPDLASRKQAYDSDLGPVTDWFAHHLHIRRRKTADLDDVATQPSVFDTDQAEFFQPRDDWEVSCTSITCSTSVMRLKGGQLIVDRILPLSTPSSAGHGAKRKGHSVLSISRSLPGSSSCFSRLVGLLHPQSPPARAVSLNLIADSEISKDPTCPMPPPTTFSPTST